MISNLREILASPLLSKRGGAALSKPEGAAQSNLSGYVLGALGAMLFSLKAVLVKLAYLPGGGLKSGELEANTLLVLRMGFALPVYVLILFWALRKSGAKRPATTIAKAAALGLLGYYLCATMDFEGLKFITAQLERLILFTYPMFVVLLGALFFGGKLSRYGLLAMVMAYGGIMLIFFRGDIAAGDNVLLGSALILATAVCFALFQLFAKGLIDKLGSQLFTCTAMIAASFAIFTHYGAVHFADKSFTDVLHLPPRIYGIAILIAFLSTLLPSFLVNIAIGKVGAQPVAVMGMLGPIATIIAAVNILGEPFGPIDALGTLITISGVGLYILADRRARS